jgi:hypothetical protein
MKMAREQLYYLAHIPFDNAAEKKEAIIAMVDQGWFLPFYSIALMPFEYFKVPTSVIRFLMLLLNIGLTIILSMRINVQIGPKESIGFLLFCCIYPPFILLNSTLFCEMFVGKLLLILLLLYMQLEDKRNTTSSISLFGILVTLCILVRQNVVFVVIPFLLFSFLKPDFHSSFWQQTRRLSKLFLPAAVVIGLSIFGWSKILNEVYGPGYITTTSTDISFMATWGSKDIRSIGDKRIENTWQRAHMYYQRKRQKENISLKEARAENLEKTLNHLGLKRYCYGVYINLKAFIPKSNGFTTLFTRNSFLPNEIRISQFFWHINAKFYYPIIGSLIFLLIFPGVIVKEKQKYVGFALLIIPFLFVHIFVATAHARHGLIVYWLFAFLIASFWAGLWEVGTTFSWRMMLMHSSRLRYKVAIWTARIFAAFLLGLVFYFG